MITVTVTIDESRHSVDIKSQSQAGSTPFERTLAHNFEEMFRGQMTRVIETTRPTLAGKTLPFGAKGR